MGIGLLEDMKSVYSESIDCEIFRSRSDWMYLVHLKFTPILRRILGREFYDLEKRKFTAKIGEDEFYFHVHPALMYAFVEISGFGSNAPEN